MSAYYKDGDNINLVVAGAALPSGVLTQVAGQAGIVQPKHDNTDYEIGEVAVVRVKGIVKIPNPNTVTATDGATIGYATATDVATAGGAGDFDAGTCVAADSDVSRIAVLLNGQDAVGP